MKINFHRHHNPGSHDAWKECQFTSGTDLSALTIRSLVTINGQPVLQQHHATYLTGKETSRAHHFAKYLAIQVLKGNEGKRGVKGMFKAATQLVICVAMHYYNNMPNHGFPYYKLPNNVCLLNAKITSRIHYYLYLQTSDTYT